MIFTCARKVVAGVIPLLLLSAYIAKVVITLLIFFVFNNLFNTFPSTNKPPLDKSPSKTPICNSEKAKSILLRFHGIQGNRFDHPPIPQAMHHNHGFAQLTPDGRFHLSTHSSSPIIRCKPIHRSAKSLFKESSYDVTPDTGTRYPCTQEELNATGGMDRRASRDILTTKDKSKLFARLNEGPFVDARTAAREVYDYNDMSRIPSAAEDEAIHRLQTGLVKAAKEGWGPDLTIKAFCDLDKAFFCGRLKGHSYLSWTSGRSSYYQNTLGITNYLGDGKCRIKLNAHDVFFKPCDTSHFFFMFAVLLHEMRYCSVFLLRFEMFH